MLVDFHPSFPPFLSSLFPSLPSPIDQGIGGRSYPKYQTNWLSTLYDVGDIIGGILCGLVSDLLKARALTCAVMLYLAIPSVSAEKITVNCLFLIALSFLFLSYFFLSFFFIYFFLSLFLSLFLSFFLLSFFLSLSFSVFLSLSLSVFLPLSVALAVPVLRVWR